ncbi:hypothetical protein ZMO02_17370 [Zymomonas mobilis subsp. pomaceae]|nr:hypothetical protein ZMO02_17370 [Zymomonas mobilis subsp. pomaceae]
MSRYIINITLADGTDSVTLTDFTYEAAEVVQTIKKPQRVRRIEDTQTGKE